MSFTPLAEGGEYKHSLTLNELVSHTHSIPKFNYTVQGSINGDIAAHYMNVEKEQSEATGSSQPFNIIQPYIGVHIWRRVA